MLRTLEIVQAPRQHARPGHQHEAASRPSTHGAGTDVGKLLATHGRTFHFATRFMPAALRAQVVVLYAFFRTLDDLVDVRDPDRTETSIRAELEAWHAWFERGCREPAPREPLGTQLAAIIAAHRLPVALFLDFLRGLMMDLDRVPIARFADLRDYAYCVAGTVGLAMAHLLGARTPQALQAAEELGIAMQLTNVLRDVGGDLRLGRVYLPDEDLRAAGISRDHLCRLVEAGRGPDEAVRMLLRAQVARACGYYQRGMTGIWLLPEETRLPVLIAARLYRAILAAIHRNDYDVLRWRATTRLPEKVAEAARAALLVTLWRGGERMPGGRMEVRYVD